MIFKTLLKYITNLFDDIVFTEISNKAIESYVLPFSKLTLLRKLFYNDRLTCNAKYFEMLGQLSSII